MIATTLAIGFHPLLLPTFILELLPVADLWPSWTVCVLAVIALSRHELRRETPEHPDIDIRPTKVQ
jgi:hypothetical protein